MHTTFDPCHYTNLQWLYTMERYCKIAIYPLPDLDYHQGKHQMNVYCILPIPILRRGRWPRSPSHITQSAYPLSLALVLIYVYWHAISCPITFSCQTVNQRGSTVLAGNRIWITFYSHLLVYLYGDSDRGWAKDIIAGIWLCCHVSTVHVCASHQDV